MIFALQFLLAIPPCVPIAFETKPAPIVWKQDVMVEQTAASPEAVIVTTGVRVIAFEAKGGTKRWEAAENGREIAIDGGRVAINTRSEIVIFALSDGRVLSRTAIPQHVRFLLGPPFVAASAGHPSMLYVIDRNGGIKVQRIVRPVEALWIADDTIVIRSARNPGESGEANVFAGFRASDLSPLWKFSAASGTLQDIGGRWYFGQTEWSTMRELDVTRGTVGHALPPKEPTDITWGGATWEVEIVSSRETRSETQCERLRVNDPATGHPRWSVDLPFAVTETLHDGGHFYVFGSRDDREHYIADIDFMTGRVLHVWSGIPFLVDDLFRIGDALVGAGLREGIFAIRIR